MMALDERVLADAMKGDSGADVIRREGMNKVMVGPKPYWKFVLEEWVVLFRIG
jgi:hypothetical protein